MNTAAPIHLLQEFTRKPLTVWRCSCGALEVGTPDSPCATRPDAHWFHKWAPVSQQEADAFVVALNRKDGDE